MKHFLNQFFSKAALVAIIPVSGANAAPICAIDILCSGNVRVVDGSDQGDRLLIGRDEIDGSVRIEAGSTASLEEGSGPLAPRPDFNQAAVSVIVGDGFEGPVSGTLDIVGDGSALIIEGDNTGGFMSVGSSAGASGTLVIEDGGALIMRDTTVVDETEFNRDIYIDVGRRAGRGEVQVDDASILLLSNSNTGIGIGTNENGDGTVVLENGGTVDIVSTGSPENRGFATTAVGRNDGGNNVGRLEVLSNSSYNIEANDGGARLDFGQVGSRGSGLISGDESQVTVSGGPDLAIARVGTGNDAVGELTVENGGALMVSGPRAVFTSGDQRFGSTEVNNAIGRTIVRDGGQIIVDGSDFGIARFGDDTPDAESDSLATLLVEGIGSRISANTFIEVGARGGAGRTTAIATVNDGGTLESSEVRVLAGGILRGDGGIIDGDLSMSGGGLISPGLSPGALTVTGDLLITGGTLDIEIGGYLDSSRDMLSIFGDLFVDDSFDLRIAFIDDFIPAEGDSFSFLSVGGLTEGFSDFANLTLFGSDGRRLSGTISNSGGVFSVSSAAVAAVPLPAGAILLVTALFGLFGLKGRWRKDF